MSTWYIRKSGNDGSAGSSAGAAWKTFGHALASGSGVVGGDTVYVGAGVYREAIAMTLAPASMVNFIGDVDGAQTGDIGEVRLTSYLTDDKTVGAGGTVIAFAAHGFCSFQKMTFVGSTAVMFSTSGAWVGNVQWIDCTLINIGFGILNGTATTAIAVNALMDRCILMTNGAGFNLTAPLTTGADYDIGSEIRNSLGIMLGGSATFAKLAQGGGAGTFKPGGMKIRNNTILGGGTDILASTANVSTTIPVLAYNNVMLGCNVALSAGVSGEIIEDYNFIQAVTLRTNVSVGTHTLGSTTAPLSAPLMELGQAAQRGARTRPFGAPTSDSPLLGFGNDGGESILVDMFNRPRPSGSGQWSNALTAVGALERGDTFIRETTTVHTGSNAVSCVGPGYQDFQVPIDAVATTFSIYCQYDASYTGTLPQVLILANGEIGVAQQSVTATVAALSAWEQETLPAITPTGKGIVTVRLLSNDTSGISKVSFDSFAVS